jgi:hypothetical protein
MLLRDEYKAFAEEVNRSVAWNPLSCEMMCYYALATIIPPLAATIMVRVSSQLISLLISLSCHVFFVAHVSKSPGIPFVAHCRQV